MDIIFPSPHLQMAIGLLKPRSSHFVETNNGQLKRDAAIFTVAPEQQSPLMFLLPT